MAWACGLAMLFAVPVQAQGPVFQLQPGISIADFASVPEGTTSTTAFSLRATTRLTTAWRWLTPVVGAVLLPYGSTGTSNARTDAPSVFVGNVVPIVQSARTGGWISLELPILLVHAAGANPHGNARDYGRDLVIAPTLFAHAGARGLRELGSAWSHLELFVQVEQNLTPNRDRTSGRRDHFNPVATFGVSLRVGEGQ